MSSWELKCEIQAGYSDGVISGSEDVWLFSISFMFSVTCVAVTYI